MKAKIKKLSKSTISIILSVIMIVSMLAVGIITTNAWDFEDNSRIYFEASSAEWTYDHMYMAMLRNSDGNRYVWSMSQISGTDIWVGQTSGLNSKWTDGSNICFFNDDSSSWGGSSTNGYADIQYWATNTSDKYGENMYANNAYFYRATNNNQYCTITKDDNKSYTSSPPSLYWSECSSIWRQSQKITVMTDDDRDGSYTYYDNGTSNGGTANLQARHMNNSSDTLSDYGYASSSKGRAADSNDAITATATYETAVRSSVVKVSATPKAGYDFVDFYDATNSKVLATASDITPSSGVYNYEYKALDNIEVYARFQRSETKYTVTAQASPAAGGSVSPASGEAGEYSTAEFTADPEDGYDFTNWTLSSDVTLASGFTDTNDTIKVNATADGTVTANFTEKAIKDITLTVGDNGYVTVTGSSVSGQNKSYGTGTHTVQAHVDDVPNFAASGSSGYKVNTLSVSGTTNTPSINGKNASYTVASGDTAAAVSANFTASSGYSFYVSAGTGANVTLTAQNSKSFDSPSGTTVTVTAGNRQKIVAEDDVTFTISGSAVDSTYNTPVTTRVSTDITKGTTISSSDVQTAELAEGVTYYVTTSSKGSTTDKYIYTSTTDKGPYNLITTTKKTVDGVDHYYAKIDKTTFTSKDVVVFSALTNRSDYTDQYFDNSYSYFYGSSNVTGTVYGSTADDSKTYLNSGNNNWGKDYYGKVNFKSNDYAGVYDVYIDAYMDPQDDNGSVYFTYSVVSSPDSGDITAFDTYYLGGRFKIKDSDTGSDIYTGDHEDKWAQMSVKLPFEQVGTSNEYVLNTGLTIADLSSLTEGKGRYFIVHDKSHTYAVGDGSGNGLDFQNYRYQDGAGSKLSIGEYSGSLSSPYEMLFNDSESNSDGTVIIHFDATSDAQKIWYTVDNETDPVVSSVTLTSNLEQTTVDTPVTLTASYSGEHSDATNLKYTFYDGEGTKLAENTTGTLEVTSDKVRTVQYKVVVSGDGTDDDTGKALRSVSEKVSVKYKSKAVYRTDVNLNGSTEALMDSSKWLNTALTDETDNHFTVSGLSNTEEEYLSNNPNYYEFALATKIPASSTDYKDFSENIMEDFYIDSKLSKYCDVEYFTLTVTYTGDDDNTETFAVTTYKVIPRTNSADPEIHIDTTPLSVTMPNGEIRYYPGRVYAIATYTDSAENTESTVETVTYYFAEAVGDEDQSVSGAGMAIAYWNNSLHNVRTGTWADNIASLATSTAVATPVNIGGSNTIYVDMTKLYAAKDTSENKQFKIYSVELPVWATTFAFMKENSCTSANVIKTTSWNDGKEYDYSSMLLNPNRVYLLYKNSSHWYSKGVVLDEKLWNAEKTNAAIGTRTFKSNAINYNYSMSDFNGVLSSRLYSDYTSGKALYFGSPISGSWNSYTVANNIAMRKSDLTPASYHASVKNLVAEKIDTDNLNENGFPKLEVYKDANKHDKVNMPLFDYDELAVDKSQHNDSIAASIYQGLDFPMYESTLKGITTYSYDSSTDPNRLIKTENGKTNFAIDTYVKSTDFLGYEPFGTSSNNDKFGNATELDVEFFMSNTGQLKENTGEVYDDITFNFSGDDDVWVFVDGVLVLDLGGAHSPSAGSINFSDMKVYYKTAANTSDTTLNVTNDTWPSDTNYVKTIDMQKLLEANGNIFNNKDASTKHTFQMFYMERGGTDSNMSVSFNLPQASGLNIKNEVTADHVNPGLTAAALYAANADYFTYGVSAQLASSASDTKYTNTISAYSGAVNNDPSTSAIAAEAGPSYPAKSNTNRVLSTSTTINGAANRSMTRTYPLARNTDTPPSVDGAQYVETTDMTPLSGVTYSLNDPYPQGVTSEDTELTVTGKTDDGSASTEAGQFHLLSGQTATFDDKITPHSFVSVYQDSQLGKVRYTDANTPIGFEAVRNNAATNYYATSYSIYDNHSSTYIKERSEGLVTDQDIDFYAFDDSDNSNMFYFSDYAKEADSAAMTVTFYNDIAVGDIRISKDYIGASASSTTDFYFDLEFANIFGTDDSTVITSDNKSLCDLLQYNMLTYTVVDSTTGALIRADQRYGTAGIRIRNGETAIISGVPVETRYKVTERERGGTQLKSIVKTIEGPDGNYIANPTPAKTTYYGYEETLDSTYLADYSTRSTSERYNTINGDKYYINMIPRVSESYVGGAYKTTSKVKFTNEKTSVKIWFKYYDRAMISGSPSTISGAETTYIANGSLPDDLTNDNTEIKSALKNLIGNAVIEFDNHCAINVVDDYTVWTSLEDAEAGIGEKTNIKAISGTGQKYKDANDFIYTKSYHTDHTGQPLEYASRSNENKWISYWNGSTYVDAETLDVAETAQSIDKIIVWVYNEPHQYDVNIYGAKSLGELSATRTVSLVNGTGADATTKTLNIRVASVTSSTNKLTGQKVYYNQRLGSSLPGTGVDNSSYINQYNQLGYREDIEPIDYITRNTLQDNDKAYRFAYWSYDPAGQIVASTNAYYYYRITNDTTLYAVYAEEDIQSPGLTVINNRNDFYVDPSGSTTVTRTRLNILLNPYGVNDSDVNIRKTAMVYVKLADELMDLSDADVIALFNEYKDQLDDILTAKARANTFNSENILNLTLSGASVINVTLTTKGYVRNTDTTQGNTDSIAVVKPTAKNRVQYTLPVKSSALKDCNLMIVGAMYYNGNYEPGVNHWKISDNCLYYKQGEPQSLDFGRTTSGD